MEGVRQAVSQHGVLQGGVAHPHTGSHVQHVRSLWVGAGNKKHYQESCLLLTAGRQRSPFKTASVLSLMFSLFRCINIV